MEKNTLSQTSVDITSLTEESKSSSKYKKIALIAVYFSSFPIFLIFVVLFTLSLKYETNGSVARQDRNLRFQALPVANAESQIDIESSDARISALDEFFAKYNSPLKGHAKTIVNEADRYGIDYRLLPAIAMQESTLCKKMIKDSYNCWGFGIYDKKVTKFESYDQAIKVISATLAKKYVQKGFVNPDEIVTKYTPNDNGRWSEVVNLIMQKLAKAL